MFKQYSCSRCSQDMHPHIVFARGKYPHDVCRLCAEDIEVFITTPIERRPNEADNQFATVERHPF